MSTENYSPGTHNPSATRAMETWEDPHIYRCEVTKTQEPQNKNKHDENLHKRFTHIIGKHIHTNSKNERGTTDPLLYVFITKGNKKKTHTHHMLLTFPFCSKDKDTKAGYPTTRCG
jgi:hypothetical protein